MKSRLVALVLLISCSSKPEDSSSSFSAPKNPDVIDARLPEVSGIASSIVNPGYIWAHNDGQNPAEVYLIDSTAQVKMTCRIKVENRDWEDIAVGPGPEKGKTYVYVGEI